MPSQLHYSERLTPIPEKRYFFESIVNWCKTNVQRNQVAAHRRLSEVQVQGMAFVLQQCLTKNTVNTNAGVASAFDQLAQTCKLAALTVDYIIQGKLTDFTGQPARITEVAKRIKGQSQLYANADYDAVWMLIAPPDSRTGDWTSFVSNSAAELTAHRLVMPEVILDDVINGATPDPMLGPGALLRYYAYQSLVDNPAQFFRLVSDTELVTTTAAMSERRRGLLRVAAAAHALANLPNLIKLRLIETSFETLSGVIGPLTLTRQQTETLEDTMRYINRVDVLPSKAIATRIQSWLADSTEPNMVGMYEEPISELTAQIIGKADFAQYADVNDPDPDGDKTTNRSLVAFVNRVEKYVQVKYAALAKRLPGAKDAALYLGNSLTQAGNFNITPEQRFLMTGLPVTALSPRFDVVTIMSLTDMYVKTMTGLLKTFSGHHEAYITTQDATEIPRLISFESYLAADPNPWRNRIDRQNSANIQQSPKGLPIVMPAHSPLTAFSNRWCDFVMTPALTRDLDEMELPLIVDSHIARDAFVNKSIPVSAYASWDEDLRQKILELVPLAGNALLPVQFFPSAEGVKAIRLTDPAHNTTGAPMEVTRHEVIDTVREYVTRATGMSGKYLAIALTVEGTAKRLATLLSSFATVWILKSPASTSANSPNLAPPKSFDPADYELVVGDGVPYGLTPANQSPAQDVKALDAYNELARLCHDQYVPLVSRLVYIRILSATPNALVRPVYKASNLSALSGKDNPHYATVLSIGRRYVALKRDPKKTTPVSYFVEAPALIHMASLPPLNRWGTPPGILLSRTNVYTLRTTAVLGETSYMLTQPMTQTVDRYTTWSGVALDRLALHGETTKIISGSSDSTAVEQAMAEAASLTAAAESQITESVKVASTPVEVAKNVEATLKKASSKGVKATSSDIPESGLLPDKP